MLSLILAFLVGFACSELIFRYVHKKNRKNLKKLDIAVTDLSTAIKGEQDAESDNR